MENSVYWIWLQRMFGIGTRRAELMMSYFEHPKEIYDGISGSAKVLSIVTTAEQAACEQAMKDAVIIEARTRKKGCEIVTPEHPMYPPNLKHIYSKPAALYAKGDLSCLQGAVAIAMVGTRTYTPYGEKAARLLAAGLAQNGVVVVSGLAKGIDTICHHTAVQAGGHTIGVLGCGIDVDYPNGSAELKTKMTKSGAVVTEFPLGTPPLPGHFPVRNRIISGICNGTLVVEADLKSGSMLTAEHAQEQGRDLFAVPGDIFAEKMMGNHALLKDGVKPVVCAADILEEYNLLSAPKTGEQASHSAMERAKPITVLEDEEVQPAGGISQLPEFVSDEGRDLYRLLAAGAQTADELAEQTGFTIAQLHVALTELELYQMIESLPGRRFIRIK